MINIFKKIIDPKLDNWVVFEQGTCVIFYNHKEDLKKEATEVMQKYGNVIPGSASADFTVMKVDNGWVVAGNQPGILNYVSEDEGKGKEDYEIGQIGRNKKDLDSRDLKIIHIQTQ